MRRVFVLCCYAVALLLMISACGNTEDDASHSADDGVDLGKEFIEALYNIDDPSVDYNDMSIEATIAAQHEFSSYFTEEEFEALANKRFFLMPQEAALTQDSTISVENIVFEPYSRDETKSDSFDFEHSFTLLFTDQKGNEVDEVELEGQMTIVDTENGWVIERYYDSEIPAELLYP